MANRVRVTIEGMASGDLEQLARILVNSVTKMGLSPSSHGVGFRDPKLVGVEFVDAPVEMVVTEVDTEAGTLTLDTPVDLSSMDRDELKALAEERGVEVVRADGRDDLEPKVSDYLAALS